ncbi:MAG: hypothetical protein WC543_00990, partial [Candidatus Omnitrophota bacterium]
IPGLRIDGWENVHPENGIEIGYSPLVWPISHTFIVVTYQGDSKIISFDATNKPLGFLSPMTKGEYSDELTTNGPTACAILTTDLTETKKMYDLADELYSNTSKFYDLFNLQIHGLNCYGGRNYALASAEISNNIQDSPWSKLNPTYNFSRSIAMDFLDDYSSYSFEMRQKVSYPSPTTKIITTNSITHYQTNPKLYSYTSNYSYSTNNFSSNFLSPDWSSWNGSSFKSLPTTYPTLSNQWSSSGYNNYSSFSSSNFSSSNQWLDSNFPSSYSSSNYQWPSVNSWSSSNYTSPSSNYSTNYGLSDYDLYDYNTPSYQSPSVNSWNNSSYSMPNNNYSTNYGLSNYNSYNYRTPSYQSPSVNSWSSNYSYNSGLQSSYSSGLSNWP